MWMCLELSSPLIVLSIGPIPSHRFIPMCNVIMRTGWNCLPRIILCLYCRQVIINIISLFIDILCIIPTAKSLLKVCRLVFCYPPTNAPPGECRWDWGSLNIFLLSSKFMSIIDLIASNSCTKSCYCASIWIKQINLPLSSYSKYVKQTLFSYAFRFIWYKIWLVNSIQ